MTSEEVQTYVWNWLLNHGLNENATAGIMGNISQESSWDVNAIESGTGIGIGLIQWSYTRRTQLEAFGIDLEHQMFFLWSELTGEYQSITGADNQWFNDKGYNYSNFINGIYSPEDSASAFCWSFERPNEVEANESYRRSEALRFFGIYTGSIPPADPPYPDPPPAETGNVYMDIIKTPYNLKQLTNSELEFIKNLAYNDLVKMKYTFNRNKMYIGKNFVGKRLTFDEKKYNIISVRKNGFVTLSYGGNSCHKYINPKFLTLN